MGNNCFKTNKVMAQDHESYDVLPPIQANNNVQQKHPVGSVMPKPKKVVRFKLEEDDEINSGGCGGGDPPGAGVLRIKVVMSQKELKQILKDRENNSCSLEELIEELKVKGRARVSDEDENGSWKPALECIPEGHH